MKEADSQDPHKALLPAIPRKANPSLKKGCKPYPTSQSRVERVPLSYVPTYGLLHPLKKWHILF